MHSNVSTKTDMTGILDASSPGNIYDVVVIGARSVGLATAISLYQRGIEKILVDFGVSFSTFRQTTPYPCKSTGTV